MVQSTVTINPDLPLHDGYDPSGIHYSRPNQTPIQKRFPASIFSGGIRKPYVTKTRLEDLGNSTHQSAPKSASWITNLARRNCNGKFLYVPQANDNYSPYIIEYQFDASTPINEIVEIRNTYDWTVLMSQEKHHVVSYLDYDEFTTADNKLVIRIQMENLGPSIDIEKCATPLEKLQCIKAILTTIEQIHSWGLHHGDFGFQNFVVKKENGKLIAYAIDMDTLNDEDLLRAFDALSPCMRSDLYDIANNIQSLLKADSELANYTYFVELTRGMLDKKTYPNLTIQHVLKYFNLIFPTI
jgi:hypothetical protein